MGHDRGSALLCVHCAQEGNGPPAAKWLRKWVALTLRYVERENRVLPGELQVRPE